MTKQFKHPKLWWVAKPKYDSYYCEELNLIKLYSETELISLWFEEVKPNDTLRERVKEWETYRILDTNGVPTDIIEEHDAFDVRAFEQWNYYKSMEWSKAVSDLRKHVYKCWPIVPWEDCFSIYYTLEYGKIIGTDEADREISVYEFNLLPWTCIQEDIDERIRLIKDCQKLVGYVTI